MSRFSKLVGMAKESYQEQRGRERTEGADDEIDRRAARIQERGRDSLGRNGIFRDGGPLSNAENVMITAKQRSAPPQLSDDKVNRALSSLHDKLIDDDYQVTGSGDAEKWPQDVANSLVVLTDHRLLVLRNDKMLTPDSILAEYPHERLEGFSHERSMKGEKLIIRFADGSSVAAPVEKTLVEGFKVKFDTRPLR